MPNRLAQESSPYLLQHQDNPVDWFPWGNEALARARELDKPIFLSIGYSACHWCHVMEHESFENEAIAQILNDDFVSIKVDREERPDLDQVYMNAVMAVRQGPGGWPLSVFLTPEQEVFFGGTYWPPTSRVGMPGFDHVLHSVLDAYSNRREQVDRQSQQITEWLNQNNSAPGKFEPDLKLLTNAAAELKRSFDFENGGFGSAPKFPHTMDLAFLIRYSDRTNEKSDWLELVRISLKKMADGGLFDHLAGGFARYSVDEYWLVPHFEKMLYDNALLVGVYLDMFLETGDQFYAMIARKTLDYLLKYMVDDCGCFHSTEDADSEGVEGKFYVWSKSEIVDALGDEQASQFCKLYNATIQGNFEGQNILNLTQSYQEFADARGIDKQILRNEMREAREKLLRVRDQRVRPGKDDKVLVSWNALAISAFARASTILDDRRYADAAVAAANFIVNEMRQADGTLFHTWRHGQAKLDGFLDDYSYLIVALLDLYQIDFDQTWISRASELTQLMILHFSDDDGGFYFTSNDQQELISRPKSFQDSSVPSGNSMAALALLVLGNITGDVAMVDRAVRVISAAAVLLNSSPLACGQMLIAIDFLIKENRVLVAVANHESELQEIMVLYRKARLANTALICQIADKTPVSELADLLANKIAVNGQPTLYDCVGFECKQPVVGIEKIESLLEQPVAANGN